MYFWNKNSSSVWPDWAIYWTLGNFLKPLATINLPKSPKFSGNFCKRVKILIFHFSIEIIFWATFIYIWRFFSGHTARRRRLVVLTWLFEWEKRWRRKRDFWSEMLNTFFGNAKKAIRSIEWCEWNGWQW